MSKTEYTTDEGLNALVASIIEDSTSAALNSIRQQEVKITPILRVKTDKDGESEAGSGAPAKIQKVNELLHLFVDSHYLLVVDNHTYLNSSSINASIFNALCSIDVKVDDGKIKLAIKKPEIQVFAATLQEYGAYDESLLGLRDWMNTAKSNAAKSFVAKLSTGVIGDEEN